MKLKSNPWLLWFLGALLFFSEYFVRTSSSVMVGDLMHAFNVNASGIGALSAFFYYPYTLMQMPVGLLVDRFPIGRILGTMAIVFSIACFIFAGSKYLVIAELSRLLMGFSAAFAFVGTLKLVTEKFSSRVLGLLAGATQAIGMLGAAVGEGPVALLVNDFGWRASMNLMGSFIALIAFLIMVFAWNIRCSHNKAIKSKVLQDFKNAILRNKQVLCNALFAGLLYAPTLAFGELWGVSYLEVVHKISHADASASLSWIFIGWGIGGPIQGLISDRIGKRKPLLYFSSGFGLFLILAILRLDLSYNMLVFCMFCYGVTNSGLVVAYAISGEINPARQTGTTIAFTNMSSVLLGAFCQPIIGKLLVKYWNGANNSFGVPVYDSHAYKSAMLFLPVLLMLSFVICFFIKETNCRKRKS